MLYCIFCIAIFFLRYNPPPSRCLFFLRTHKAQRLKFQVLQKSLAQFQHREGFCPFPIQRLLCRTHLIFPQALFGSFCWPCAFLRFFRQYTKNHLLQLYVTNINGVFQVMYRRICLLNGEFPFISFVFQDKPHFQRGS